MAGRGEPSAAVNSSSSCGPRLSLLSLSPSPSLVNLFAIQDPFRGGNNILVLCETCLPVTGEPIPSNTRAKARAAFDAAPGLEPWFGIEQEYTLFDKDMVNATV